METLEERPSARERILDAAYELFSRSGVHAVGVDAVVARAGVAKMTLYRNFASKDELAVAYLAERDRRWTVEWFQAETDRRGATPSERLLAVFDVLAEWYTWQDFAGCSFVHVLLETCDRSGPVHQACIAQLQHVREYLAEQAAAAGIADSEGFASQWHILIKGATIAAVEGDEQAAARAREVGELLLERWLPA